jgi:hypothetical protein
MADDDSLAEQFDEKRGDLLDPNIVLRADHRVLGTRRAGGNPRRRGYRRARGQRGARAAQPALIDVVAAPRGKLLMVLEFTVVDGRIAEMEAIADRDRLRQIDLAVLG